MEINTSESKKMSLVLSNHHLNVDLFHLLSQWKGKLSLVTEVQQTVNKLKTF